MRHVFVNRWMALIWSAGIVWMAIDFAAPQRDSSGHQVTTDVSGAEVGNDQANQVEHMILDL